MRVLRTAEETTVLFCHSDHSLSSLSPTDPDRPSCEEEVEMSFLTCCSFVSEVSLTDSFFFEAVTLMVISYASWEVNRTGFFAFWEEIRMDFSSASLEVN